MILSDDVLTGSRKCCVANLKFMAIHEAEGTNNCSENLVYQKEMFISVQMASNKKINANS